MEDVRLEWVAERSREQKITFSQSQNAKCNNMENNGESIKQHVKKSLGWFRNYDKGPGSSSHDWHTREKNTRKHENFGSTPAREKNAWKHENSVWKPAHEKTCVTNMKNRRENPRVKNVREKCAWKLARENCRENLRESVVKTRVKTVVKTRVKIAWKNISNTNVTDFFHAPFFTQFSRSRSAPDFEYSRTFFTHHFSRTFFTHHFSRTFFTHQFSRTIFHAPFFTSISGQGCFEQTRREEGLIEAPIYGSSGGEAEACKL